MQRENRAYQRRLRRVAIPTNLDGLWVLRPGKTMADWQKALNSDPMKSKKGGCHEK